MKKIVEEVLVGMFESRDQKSVGPHVQILSESVSVRQFKQESEVQISSESLSEYKAFKKLVSEFERMSEVASVSEFF